MLRVQCVQFHLNKMNTVGLQKNATIKGSITEGEGHFEATFGATFRVNTGQFTWHNVAS